MTSRTSLALAVAAAMVIACGGTPKPPPPRTTPGGEAALKPAAAPDAFAPTALMKDVQWLCDDARKGRGSYQPGGVAASNYVAEQFRVLGLEVVRQPVLRGSENIIGILRGDASAVIVSAHHDHLGVDPEGVVFPGADDNASGVAVMLAIARDAVRHKHQHTILFIAFGAEEKGLVGSAVYVRQPHVPLERTLAVINFDMVGRNFFEAGANQRATVAVIGLETDEAALRVTEAAARAAGLKLVSAPAKLLEVFGYANRTDDWWFRRQGIHAFHFSTGFHDDYHQPTDVASKLVPEQMSRVARTAASLLYHLAVTDKKQAANSRSTWPVPVR